MILRSGFSIAQGTPGAHTLLWRFIVLSVAAHLLLLLLPDRRADTELSVDLAAPLRVSIASQPAVVSTRPARSQQSSPQVKKRTPPAHSHSDKVATTPMKPPPHALRTAAGAPDSSSHISPNKAVVDAQDEPAAAETTSLSTLAQLNHLRQRLREMMAARFTYPRLARRMGWEGMVALSLHIEHDGRLQHVRIKRTSGHKVLDENARSTLQRIGRITLAENLPIQTIDTEIEVLYRLTN